MGKIVAAIASNRPELCKKAVEAWKARKEFDSIWVMWDQTSYPGDQECNQIYYHDKKEPSCIPTGSGCCRSRLVLEAWKDPDVEWLVHLDDDVMPINGRKWKEMTKQLHPDSSWFKIAREGGRFTRGHPYGVRTYSRLPHIVHGCWNGMPDLDAATQLQYEYKHAINLFDHSGMPVVIPRGQYFAMSAMAVAIHRDLFPASYFMWMGKDLPLNKFGDIWCGVILKRICDHFGWIATNGSPVVHHERASNVWSNYRQEGKCIEENESFWRWVDAVDISKCSTVIQCYEQIATQMEMPKRPEYKELRKKMMQWGGLFK